MSARARSIRRQAIIERVRGPLLGIPGALVVPFNAAGRAGLGQLRRIPVRGGGPGAAIRCRTIANAAHKLVAQGNASKDLTRPVHQLHGERSAVSGEIDREKAKACRCRFSQITDALQVYMGSVYVNDFDFNNRSYRVYVQADQQFRAQAKDIRAVLRALRHREDDPAG